MSFRIKKELLFSYRENISRFNLPNEKGLVKLIVNKKSLSLLPICVPVLARHSNDVDVLKFS